MKKQLRALAWFSLLLFLFSGCSEDVKQSSSVAVTAPGASSAAMIVEGFREPDRLARTENLISLLRAVPADQTDVFKEALSRMNFPNRELDRVLITTAWAKRDPVAATKWARSHERSEIVRSAMYGDAIYYWALKDPESFLADMEMALWIMPGFDASALRGFVRGWFDSGQPGLEGFIRDMASQSQDQQRAIDTLAKVRTERHGAAATIKWAEELRGSARFKSDLYPRVAAKVVVVDPELVVEWCDRVCDSEAGDKMPHMMAAAWARESGEGAMDFIAAQPNKIPVRTGARAAYRKFLIADSDRALAWMDKTTEEQRSGPVLQGPVAMYINKRSAQNEPLIAIEWLDYLQNEEERDGGRTMIARRWLLSDAVAAEAWMAESSMSEEAKVEARRSFATGAKKG
jgi:hypothetical protein